MGNRKNILLFIELSNMQTRFNIKKMVDDSMMFSKKTSISILVICLITDILNHLYCESVLLNGLSTALFFVAITNYVHVAETFINHAEGFNSSDIDVSKFANDPTIDWEKYGKENT